MKRFSIVACLVLMGTLLSQGSSQAANLLVSIPFGTAIGSLPYAINQANNDSGDVIYIDGGIGTVTLSAQLPTITSAMRIIGPGASSFIIDGGGTIRPFTIDAGALTVTISGLTIQNGSDVADSNGGAGITVASGDLQMSDCVLSNNTAKSDGGAIFISDEGSAELTDCTLSGNEAAITGWPSAGGAIANVGGSCTLTACTLTDNSAYVGGALSHNRTGGSLTVTNCTLCSNSATYGGAIYMNDGSNTITNCTISGNSAAGSGSGIENSGATTTVENSILYGDTSDEISTNGGTTTVSFCDIAGGITSGVTDGGSNISGDPLLSGLGSYEGPTQTMALLPGSAALGAGAYEDVDNDQRGFSIPQNDRYDIGAFESQGFSVTLSDGNDQSATVDSAFASSLSVTVAAVDPEEPISGGLLTFTGPSTGAGATILGSPASMGYDGLASATATANSIGGSYSIVAGTGAGSATFSLSNVALTPTADSQSVTVAQDSDSNGITLTGSDPASLSLTYTVGGPSNGSLSGSAPNLTYTPDPGYYGSDSFTFNVSNGTATSDDATVSITVVGTPSADSQSVTVAQGSDSNDITLTGSDPNSPTLLLTYTVDGGPTNGSLSGTAPNLTYTPDPGYYGSDSFTFNVSNGTATSADATVSIKVVGTPSADSQSVTVVQDSGSNSVTLTGSDPNSPPLALTYNVDGGPSNGSLNGSAPNLTYTPNAGYYGPDSFTFNVSNGSSTSSDATVSISVIGTPTADSQSVTVAKDSGGNTVTLTGSDPNSMSLTYTVDDSPANGSLSGTAPNLAYTPDPGYYGPDSFTFSVTNGSATSADSTVTITVSGTAVSDLYVTTLTGIGPGSLPYAISAANFDSGDTIHFLEGLTGTLSLSESLPTITAAMTITGPGASSLAIDGGGTIRPFVIDTGGPTVTISGLTIKNGSDQADGYGGAGLQVYSGDLNMCDCVLSNNNATGDGGALFIFSGASAELDECSLSNNSAGVAGGTLGGGAIKNANGSVTLTACTLNGNSAFYGGAMFDVGPDSVTTITSCTLCANTATVGGAIFTNAGSHTIKNCTISGNTAGGGSGIFITGGTTTLSNCILFGDKSASEINNVNGGTVTASNCDIAGGIVSGITDGGSNISGNPLLSALGSYGGPTQTLALLPGSAALGAGVSEDIAADQRGISVPQSGRYDIGAFESRGFTVTINGGNGQSANVGTAFASPLSVTVAAAATLEPVTGGHIKYTPASFADSATIQGSPATIGEDGSASATATATGVVGGPYPVFVDTGAGSATFGLINVALPTADSQSVTVAQDSESNGVTLTGLDPASLQLTYTIDSGPSNGTLSGTAPNLTYAPNADYLGADSFTFKISNGAATSSDATVSITVVGTPTASNQTAAVTFNTAAGVTLTGSDPNTPPETLTYAVATQPANGTISGSAPNLTYTPNHGFSGPDTFRFTVTNTSSLTSAPATVTLNVATNVPPAPAPPNPVVPSPIISPSGGAHNGSATITVTDSLGTAVIYYTTNGTAPTSSSTRYAAPFTVATSEVVKAIALAQGYTNSPVTSASFIIAMPIAPIPTIAPSGGTFTTAQSVTITDSLGGATLYYTTNGTTPSGSSEVYSDASPLTVTANETIEAIAVAGGYTNSPAASATFVIAPLTPTPAISPNGGTFTGALMVTITDALAGTAIYYTKDGSSPTVSSMRYSGPINVSFDQTIKAIATAPGLTPSPVSSATFTIALPAPTPRINPFGGSFTAPQAVTITDSLAGASIYFTLDGTPPTTSSAKYMGTITVSSSETITAIAIGPTYSQSPDTSAKFVVTLPVMHVFQAGLAMISMPEDYTGQSLDAVLGYASPMLAIWDTASNTYDLTPAPPANSLAVGFGYWARFPAAESINAVGLPTPTDSQFIISLHKGWNMVGDPFPADIDISAISIINSDGIAMPFGDAFSSGIIGGPVYGFNGANYVVSTTLSPYQGYWVLANSDCILSVPPP